MVERRSASEFVGSDWLSVVGDQLAWPGSIVQERDVDWSVRAARLGIVVARCWRNGHEDVFVLWGQWRRLP